MLQDDIIQFAEAYDESIHFVKKQGLSLQFTSNDDQTFASELKKALKADSRFKALYFNVEDRKSVV